MRQSYCHHFEFSNSPNNPNKVHAVCHNPNKVYRCAGMPLCLFKAVPALLSTIRLWLKPGLSLSPTNTHTQTPSLLLLLTHACAPVT